MDFVADELSHVGKFRIPTVVDVFNRQALAVEAGSRPRGENVVEMLNRLTALHGAPTYVFVVNSPVD
jgi:putative transposase